MKRTATTSALVLALLVMTGGAATATPTHHSPASAAMPGDTRIAHPASMSLTATLLASRAVTQRVAGLGEVSDGMTVTVTTRYVDQDDAEIVKPKTTTGAVGEAYSTKQRKFAGYEFIEASGSAVSGTVVAGEPIEVTYKYQALAQTLTVNYVDEAGKALAAAATKSNVLTGAEYKTDEKTFTGYELTGTPENAKGQMLAGGVVVNYVYRSTDRSVTVTYTSDKGKELAPSKVTTFKQGAKYTTEKKTITGYTLTDTPGNATGTIEKEDVTVAYVYKANEVELKVLFVDDKGKALAEPDVSTVVFGEEYTTEPEDIPGYAATTPKNATGEVGTKNIEVKYVYKANAQVLTIKYVDVNGNQIAPAEEQAVVTGAAYTTTAKKVTGYEVVSTPLNAKGTMGTEPITVTYTYQPTAETVYSAPTSTGTTVPAWVGSQGSSNTTSTGETPELAATGISITGALVITATITTLGIYLLRRRVNSHLTTEYQ